MSSLIALQKATIDQYIPNTLVSKEDTVYLLELWDVYYMGVLVNFFVGSSHFPKQNEGGMNE